MTITVAVIGLGMGRGHVQHFHNHPDASVVALCDLNEDLLRRVGDEFDVRGRYTDCQAMLEAERPDVVSIATPNKLHRPLTIAALEAGAHVLCEKPMAMNAQEAEEMLAVARRTGRRLMINFSFRFSGAAWGMKQVAASGRLGEIYAGRSVWMRRYGMPKFGGWFGTKALSGGGPLIDLGVHRLDLALWWMGYPEPEWVLAQTHNHIGTARAQREGANFDVEDFASAMIRFTNGAVLQLEASWAGHIRDKEYMETRVMGTEAGLHHHNLNGGYQFHSAMYSRENEMPTDHIFVDPFPGPPSAMHHFIDCIRDDVPHVATGEEGHTVMRLLDAIYQSAERGEPVHIARD
ncbi:MAG: Gfo/Idh/MocA family protein [Planctomycetota bacterium]